MNIYEKVIERDKEMCQNCYGPGEEIHHIIFGRGKRKEHERLETMVLLCSKCHRGTNGVHGKNGRELNLKFKRELQDFYIEMGYNIDEVRELLGGKIY